MTKDAFSLGPWDTYYDGATHVIVTEGESDYVGSALHAPDARLIATSPELYEALEDLAERLVPAFPSLADTPEVRRALAALAKVRGEQ